MKDTRIWLAGLGLEKYAEVLEQNEVDFEILRELSEADLIQIGIPLGPRKKLIKAIAALPEPEQAPPEDFASWELPEAERRQITVLACDLVNSTVLADRLDPEDLKNIIYDYDDACTSAVRRYEGYPGRYRGDDYQAYFGYPTAHEHDAERAIRAAFDILKNIARLEYHGVEGVHVRIGIATGLVVVHKARQEQIAVGHPMHLAARLQTLAKSDAVVACPLTRKLAGDVFQYEDLGTHALKGFSQTVQCYGVKSESESPNRFQMRQASALTPLVGREAELQLLLSRFHQSMDDEGQVLFLTGDPGIGKSRLISELLQQTGETVFRLLQFQCYPYYVDSALFPILKSIGRVAGFRAEDTEAEKFDRLSALFEATGAKMDSLPFICSLLGLKHQKFGETGEVSPAKQRELTIDGVLEVLSLTSGKEPVVVILEDIHWADPTTLSLLEILAARTPARPVFVVASYRNQFDHRLDVPNATTLRLTRLSRQAGTRLFYSLIEHTENSGEMAAGIVERGDGVPLFIEEITKMRLAGSFERAQTEEPQSPERAVEPDIPLSLKTILSERLDQTEWAKEFAQAGAAIGREFSFQLLQEVTGQGTDNVLKALQRLVSSGLLVSSEARLEQAVFTFRHALLQDAALENLLLKQRRAIHARIASILLANPEAYGEVRPEVLAYHYVRSGDGGKSIHYWELAARESIELAAYDEAIHRLQHAIDIIDIATDKEAYKAAHCRIQTVLGDIYRRSKGTGAVETHAAYARAANLGRDLNDRDNFGKALYGCFISAYMSARLPNAEKAATELLAVGSDNGDSDNLVAGHQAVGLHAFATGDFHAAKIHLGIAADHDAKVSEQLSDLQIPSMSLSYLACVQFITGEIEYAVSSCEKSIDNARRESIFSVALSLGNSCYIYQFLGDTAKVRQLATELSTLAVERGYPAWIEIASFFIGWVAAREERSMAEIERYEQPLASWYGTEIETPYFMAVYADALQANERFVEAKEMVDRAVELASDSGEKWFLAELLRMRAVLAAQRDTGHPDAKVQSCFRAAIETAREQSASMWEFKAAAAYAGYLLSNGDKDNARRLIESSAGCISARELAKFGRAPEFTDELWKS